MLAMWHRVMTRPLGFWPPIEDDVNVLAKNPDLGAYERNRLRRRDHIYRELPLATERIVISPSIISQCDDEAKSISDCIRQNDYKAKQNANLPEFAYGSCIPPFDRTWTECTYFENNGRPIQIGVFILFENESDSVKSFSAEIVRSDQGDPWLWWERVDIQFDHEGNLCHIQGDDGQRIYIHYVLRAFAFLHCKNVRQLDITATHGPDAKFCRRQRVPSVVYKTLLIPGFTYEGRIVNDDGTLGDLAPESIDRRIHIVRGHFATYTEDKPRFGRASNGVGKFWIPQHTRGTTAAGAVVKDYEVAPPPPPSDDTNNPQA